MSRGPLFSTLRATAIKISRFITLGALLFCGFAASAQPLVSVFKSVHATGDELRLGELAELKGFELVTRARVAQIKVLKAPEPGAELRLSRGAILKKIREKLEGELSIVPEYRAPKRVSVDRVSFKLSAERLSRYVEDAALAYGPIGSLKLSRVKVPRLSALKVPEGATLSLTASAGHIPSRVPVDLELRGSGRLLRRQRLLVELDYLQDVVVLTNQLAVGSILKRSDLTMVAVSAQKLPPSVIVSPDEIVGAKLRQSIGPKIPLRKAWLWVPPLIKRGAKVMMTFKKGNLTISAEGQALSDGAKGDVIQIKNIQSKKTVSGRVVAPNQVEVEF